MRFETSWGVLRGVEGKWARAAHSVSSRGDRRPSPRWRNDGDAVRKVQRPDGSVHRTSRLVLRTRWSRRLALRRTCSPVTVLPATTRRRLGQLVPGPNGLEPPAPGQASVWAKADSYESHPSYDPEQHYPDIGFVYLDRKLPFDPLPLLRTPLAANRQVTISGWGANSTPTPTTGAGGRVQRTGTSRTLGSPTAADYHPEDPNPGLLVPANLPNLLKLDGTLPNATPALRLGAQFWLRSGGRPTSRVSISPVCRAQSKPLRAGQLFSAVPRLRLQEGWSGGAQADVRLRCPERERHVNRVFWLQQPERRQRDRALRREEQLDARYRQPTPEPISARGSSLRFRRGFCEQSNGELDALSGQ